MEITGASLMLWSAHLIRNSPNSKDFYSALLFWIKRELLAAEIKVLSLWQENLGLFVVSGADAGTKKKTLVGSKMRCYFWDKSLVFPGLALWNFILFNWGSMWVTWTIPDHLTQNDIKKARFVFADTDFSVNFSKKELHFKMARSPFLLPILAFPSEKPITLLKFSRGENGKKRG